MKNITAENVEKLVVRVYTAGAKVTDNREMSDICMQHMCALMLIDGKVTLETAHDQQRMHDPEVLALRRRVELVGMTNWKNFARRSMAIVEVSLRTDVTSSPYPRRKGYCAKSDDKS